MKQCDVIAVSMGIIHNVLWVDILNLDGILCFWAKLGAFKAKDVFRTWILWRRTDSLRAKLSDVFVTLRLLSNLKFTASK